MKISDIIEAINAKKPRSAWDRGVRAYAVELLEDVRSDGISLLTPDDLHNTLLCGASDWEEYSTGSYIAALWRDEDIAARLCAPWELRRTDGGRKQPNTGESWIDVQARALWQAEQLIRDAMMPWDVAPTPTDWEAVAYDHGNNVAIVQRIGESDAVMYGVEDYIRAAYIPGGKIHGRVCRHKIYYTLTDEARPYIRILGRRVYMDECMRYDTPVQLYR